ncbi:MAG TPA: hypothetical protein VLB27_11420, partial [candidate division Zixibacteria bacterium]|nr:hypothetical protein [candidate division Zixibacteria bacterium]
MMNMFWTYRVGAPALALIVAALAGSCSNPEDPTVDYGSAIEQFMNSELDAKELFDYPIPLVAEYTLDTSGGALRRWRVDSVARGALTVTISSSGGNVPGYQEPLNWAEARRVDRVYGSYTERRGVADPEYSEQVVVNYERRGLFLKLDPDGFPYSGWSLQGFRSAVDLSTIQTDMTITVHPKSGFPYQISSLPAGFNQHTLRPYWPSLDLGDSVDIRAPRTRFDIYAHTSNGFRALTVIDEGVNGYHAGFRAPASSPGNRFFYSMVFHSDFRMKVNTAVQP